MELIFIERNYKNACLRLTFVVLLIVTFLNAVSVNGIRLAFYSYISNLYENKAEEIADKAMDKLGKACFTDENKADSEKNSFKDKEKLNEIREIANLNSLYLIKKVDNKIVYLSSSFNSYKNYYALGKRIDEKIEEPAKIALSGKEYFSKKVINIDENAVFLYIKPVYDDNNKVIGGIGVEMDGKIINDFNSNVKKIIIPAMIFLSIITLLIFYFAFKIELNKLTDRLIYIDNLTCLKNRMAYEKKIEKLNNKIKDNPEKDPLVGILVYDLNDLKIVNDTLGHLAGDKYIKNSAKLIDSCFNKYGKTYRIGGDEFITVIENNSPEKVNLAIAELRKAEEEYNNEANAFVMSIAVGYDYFYKGMDLNLTSVVKRADEKMYRAKKESKKKSDRSPR